MRVLWAVATLLVLFLVACGLGLGVARDRLAIEYPPAPTDTPSARPYPAVPAERNAFLVYREAVSRVQQVDGSDDPSVVLEAPDAFVRANGPALALLSKAHALPDFQAYSGRPDLHQILERAEELSALQRLGTLGLAAASQAWKRKDYAMAERRLLEVLTLGQRLRQSPDANLLSSTTGRIIVVNWLMAIYSMPPEGRRKIGRALVKAIRSSRGAGHISQVLLNHRDAVLASLSRPDPPPDTWQKELHSLASRRRIVEFYGYVDQEMQRGHFAELREALGLLYPEKPLDDNWRTTLAAVLHPRDLATWPILQASVLGDLSLFVIEEPYTENSLACVELALGEADQEMRPDAFSPDRKLRLDQDGILSVGPDGDEDGPEHVVWEAEGAYVRYDVDAHLKVLELQGDLFYGL